LVGAEAADGHVVFATDWGGLPRHVFIPYSRIDLDAGQELSRGEAVDFVTRSANRYKQEAMLKNAKSTSIGPGTTILLEATPPTGNGIAPAKTGAQDVIDLEPVRRKVAQRAFDLTGITPAKILEDLSPITFGPNGPDPTSWVLVYIGSSPLARAAVEHAISELR
jgi:hypothetical protein